MFLFLVFSDYFGKRFFRSASKKRIFFNPNFINIKYQRALFLKRHLSDNVLFLERTNEFVVKGLLQNMIVLLEIVYIGCQM